MRSKTRQKCQSTTKNLQNAINHAKKLPYENVAVIARRFGVVQLTLDRRLKGITQARSSTHEVDQLFTTVEEKAIET